MCQRRIQSSYKNIPNSTSYTRMKNIQYEEVENVIQAFPNIYINVQMNHKKINNLKELQQNIKLRWREDYFKRKNFLTHHLLHLWRHNVIKIIEDLVTKRWRVNVHIRRLKGKNSNCFIRLRICKIQSKQKLAYSVSDEKNMMNNAH